MANTPEFFVFNEERDRDRLPVKRVRALLPALEAYPGLYDPDLAAQPLSSTNRAAIEKATEAEIIADLEKNLYLLENKMIDIATLRGHSLFQAVLQKAYRLAGGSE